MCVSVCVCSHPTKIHRAAITTSSNMMVMYLEIQISSSRYYVGLNHNHTQPYHMKYLIHNMHVCLKVQKISVNSEGKWILCHLNNISLVYH